MNFKSMTLKAAALAALSVTSAAAFAAPSQAASIGAGDFSFSGKTKILTKTGSYNNPSSVTIGFSGFSLDSVNEAFSNLKGIPKLANLTLVKTGSPLSTTPVSFIYGTAKITDFITGIYLDKNNNSHKDPGEEVSFNLDPTNFTGSFTSATKYNFGGNFFGEVKNGNTVMGSGFLGAVRLNRSNRASGTIATAVPTPALIPGLLGLGVAALRKRKSEESEVEAAETAKA